MEKILKEIELISILKNAPKDVMDKHDVQIGTIRNESIKKFYCYLFEIQEQLEDLNDKFIEIVNKADVKDIAEQSQQIEYQRTKLEEKAEALQYFFTEMLIEEFGKQAECLYRDIKLGWVIVKPECKICREKSNCTIYSELIKNKMEPMLTLIELRNFHFIKEAPGAPDIKTRNN